MTAASSRQQAASCTPQPWRRRSLGALAAGTVVAALYLSSRSSYLLFHTLAEVFSIVIDCAIFMIAWNARKLLKNNYLLLIGISFLFIAGLDLAHTLAYPGMNIFPGITSDPPTQLWIATRFMQALSLLAAPLALNRNLRPKLLLLGYASLSVLILLSIFVWKIFPVCYAEGIGLTRFKIVSEYEISLILMAAAGLLIHHRKAFDPQVLRWLLWTIGLTVASELAFTSYVSVYGPANMVGHILKIAASFLIYKAIIETGLVKPLSLLLRKASHTEERYRLIFDLSPDPIFSVDTSGRFLVVNPACEVLSGYSAGELLQMSFRDICASAQLDATLQAFSKRTDEPFLRQVETAMIRKDGKRIDVWVTGKPLILDGQVAAIYCSAKDISERKQFQSELERSVRERTVELQDLVGELEHFSYTITHDMRAPLRAMRGFAGMLHESCAGQLDSQSLDYLEKLSGSAERMDRLITDALHYSKTIMREVDLRRVNVVKLLRGIIEVYPDLQPPKAEISIEGSIPDMVANEAGLIQCFSNILNNAVKFIGPGKTPKVRIWAELKDGLADAELPESIHAGNGKAEDGNVAPAKVARIWFEDNGIGIPISAQGRLFQMFQRVSRDHEGTGIGLALVRKISERMGGRVGVESEPGQGSRFWLEYRVAS